MYPACHYPELFGRFSLPQGQLERSRVGEILNISEMSYEFSELTARTYGTLLLFSNGERCANLNTHQHETALSRDPT